MHNYFTMNMFKMESSKLGLFNVTDSILTDAGTEINQQDDQSFLAPCFRDFIPI